MAATGKPPFPTRAQRLKSERVQGRKAGARRARAEPASEGPRRLSAAELRAAAGKLPRWRSAGRGTALLFRHELPSPGEARLFAGALLVLANVAGSGISLLLVGARVQAELTDPGVGGVTGKELSLASLLCEVFASSLAPRAAKVRRGRASGAAP